MDGYDDDVLDIADDVARMQALADIDELEANIKSGGVVARLLLRMFGASEAARDALTRVEPTDHVAIRRLQNDVNLYDSLLHEIRLAQEAAHEAVQDISESDAETMRKIIRGEEEKD